MSDETSSRVRGYDLARAVAILGMVLINFQVFLLSRQDDAGMLAHWLGKLPSGRSSALFVTLAGAGIALMARGADPSAVRNTLLRRALVLFFAGNLLILVFWIEILHFYAFYLAIAALLFVRLPRTFLLPLAGLVTLAAPLLRLAFPDVDRPRGDAYWTPLGMLQDVVGWGIHPLLPWLAFLLVGMWIGHHDLRDRPTRGRLMLLGALVAVAAPLASASLESLAGGSILPVEAMRFLGTRWSPEPFYVLAAAGTSTLAIGATQAIAERWPTSWPTRALVATGQLALTIYLLHALVGVGVPRWLLDLERRMAWASVVAWSFGFVALVVPLAWLWRRRFARGPLEALLRLIAGTTPPRVAQVERYRAAPMPRWPWAIVLVGAALVLALRVVGDEARWGCPPSDTIAHRANGQLTLTCPRQSYELALDEAREVTLETHSGQDLFLELYDGERRVAENDDGGEGLDARIVVTLAPGRYRVIVRPFDAATGGYVLTRTDGPPREERPGCSNTCRTAHDGECDDGGPGSLYDICALGTDCADCGPR